MTSPYALEINIDGSYRPKEKKGGLAGLVTYPESFNKPSESIFALTYTPTTINQMELEACVRALIYVQKNARLLGINHVVIYTDSRYVADHQYLCHQWKKNKWLNHDGKPISNVPIWEKFIRERRKASSLLRVEIIWKQGKTTPENLQVDALAKQASRALGGKRHPAYRNARITRTLGKVKSKAILYNGIDTKINVRMYSDVHKGKYLEVRFELYDVSTKKHNAKYIAYSDPSISHLIHRGHYYKIEMDGSEKLPMILKIKALGKKHLPKKLK